MIPARAAQEASWTCTELDSQQIGPSEFLTCGRGCGPDEQTARDVSLQAAARTWSTLCDLSVSCKPFESTAVPRRLECREIMQGKWECLRAMLWVVSTTRKSDVVLSLPDLEKAIEAKRKILSELETQYRLQRESKSLDEQIQQAEASLVDLSRKDTEAKSPHPEYQVKRHNNLWGLRFDVAGAPVRAVSLTTYSVGVTFQRRVLSTAGVRLGLSYRYGSNYTDSSPENQFQVGGLEASVGIPVILGAIEVQPQAGYMFGTLTESSPSTVGSMIDTHNRTEHSWALRQPFVGGSASYRFGENKNWAAGLTIKRYSGSSGFEGSTSFGGIVSWEW